MSKKGTAMPDSDQTARPKHNQNEDLGTVPETEGGQTSLKTGKRSSAEKLAASRPEFNAHSNAKPVPGAFGNDEEDVEHTEGNSGQATRDKALQPKLEE